MAAMAASAGSSQGQGSAQGSPGVCRFYLQGRCVYGDSCRYRHEDEAAAPGTTEASAPDTPADSNWGQPFPWLVQGGADDGGGSRRLGRWSRGGATTDAATTVQPAAGAPDRTSSDTSEDFQLVYAALPSGNKPPQQSSRSFVPAGAAASSQAISIPGMGHLARSSGSASSDALAQALSGSSSPPDYGLSSAPTGMSPEEEAALEDAIATQLTMGTGSLEGSNWDQHTLSSSAPSSFAPELSRVPSLGQLQPEPEPETAYQGHRDQLCQFHMGGFCRNGLSCPFIHGEVCPICGMACLHPFDEKEQQKHLEQCQEALYVEHECAASMELDCGICMEKTFQKGVKFGILPSCNHVFCLECIRAWRTNSETYGSDAVRVCPICRVESYIVVPSERFVDEPDRKAMVIEQYKQTLKRIPCKYFKFGEGTCPFAVGGTLQGAGGCMFAHCDREGRPIEENRLYMGEDGELQRIRTYDLCDFIAPKKSQGSKKKKK